MADENGHTREGTSEKATLTIDQLAQAGFPFDPRADQGGIGVGDVLGLLGLSVVGELAPHWWSAERDAWLRREWKRNDYIKAAVYTFISKIVGIPFQVLPRDSTIKAHQRLAVEMGQALQKQSGLFKGFNYFLKQFVLDYLTQDNGAWGLIMGGGRADGPLIGPAMGLYHLESGRITRKGDPEFPCTYRHTDNRTYKLHYTRVIEMTRLPDTRASAYGVGHCAFTGCLNAAQELLDSSVLTQEFLGSRPKREIIFVRKGATATALSNAIQQAEFRMDQQHLTRFSKSVIFGPDNARSELDIGRVPLSGFPEGFDRQKNTMLAVMVVAANFGLSTRSLAHAMGLAGQTRADAEVQQADARGKGVGQFIKELAELLDEKVLPPPVKAGFDYVDDEQDAQQADIKDKRSETHERDLNDGILDVRTVRQQMVADGDLSDQEFEALELAAGRLPDGADALALFDSPDPDFQNLLALPVVDPLAVADNDPEMMRREIGVAMADVQGRILGGGGGGLVRKARWSLAALKKLEGLYARPEPEEGA